MMRFLAPLALALALLAGCTKSEPAVSWFPLVEGTTWHYKSELFKRKQVVDSHYRVLGTRTIEGLGDKPGVAVEEKRSTEPVAWSGKDETEVALYVAEGDFWNRLYIQYDGGKPVPQSGFEDRKVLPIAMRPGLQWESKTVALTFEGQDFGNSHGHQLVRETEPVVVPAGVFRDTLRLETISIVSAAGTGKPEIVYVYREWYAPGIGLVRMDAWGDRDRKDERSRTELLEYVPGGGEKPAA